jgi:hypothetical protein
MIAYRNQIAIAAAIDVFRDTCNTKIVSSSCELGAEFYNSLPSFDFPLTKVSLQKCHPSSTPLHYGNIHKVENAHSSNITGFCLQSSKLGKCV